jgi:hypothetical protein
MYYELTKKSFTSSFSHLYPLIINIQNSIEEFKTQPLCGVEAPRSVSISFKIISVDERGLI